MHYALAKKLKDLDFPQQGEGRIICDEKRDEEYGGYRRAYVPTLSELIEALGDDFGGISKEGEWRARMAVGQYEAWGLTPEIAVAELWLILKTQSQ